MNGKDWLQNARPILNDYMERHEGEHIHFNILGLVRDPICNLRQALAENICCLQTALTHSSSAETLANEKSWILGPSERYGIDHEMLHRVAPFSSFLGPGNERERTIPLISRIQDLKEAQTGLVVSIDEAQQARRQDEDKSDRRRFDFGPVLQTWIRLHARKGVIESLLNPA